MTTDTKAAAPRPHACAQHEADLGAALARIEELELGLRKLCRFIAESIEGRSMNSIALEMEWHNANASLERRLPPFPMKREGTATEGSP